MLFSWFGVRNLLVCRFHGWLIEWLIAYSWACVRHTSALRPRMESTRLESWVCRPLRFWTLGRLIWGSPQRGPMQAYELRFTLLRACVFVFGACCFGLRFRALNARESEDSDAKTLRPSYKLQRLLCSQTSGSRIMITRP